jgi:ribosomal protein S18 acetylase RimI-like enzyme
MTLMRRAKKRTAEDAPTAPRDWVAAVEIRPDRRPLLAGRSMTFFLYAASNDPTLFVALARNDRTLLPTCPKRGQWKLFKSFVEAGRPRIGFDETPAKRDIAADGYHLFRIRIDTSEVAARKSA